MKYKANPGKSKSPVQLIRSGHFKEQYIIYARKSTDEADSQKNSISYQTAEITKYARREKLPVAEFTMKGFCTNGIVAEKHSGFKEDLDVIVKQGVVQYKIDRPKFQKLLEYASQGSFKGVICLCWDRISRNKGDDTVVRKLMRKGIDFRFVYAKYDQTSSGALHMDIDGMFSQHHSRVTSEKVTLATRNSRAQGICTYRAPMGYLNQGKMDKKPFDPKRAPIIRKLFELYATGDWTLADLAGYAKEQGLTTLPMRRRRTPEEMLDENLEIEDIPKISRPITENHISRILTNRFYTGRILSSDGLYVPSHSHKALVDDFTFERVQEALRQKQVSVHYTKKLRLPFRGMLRCAQCNRAYSPYTKKDNLYFGARCRKGCGNTLKSFNLSYVEGHVGNLLTALYLNDEEIEQLSAHMKTSLAILEEKRHDEIEKLNRQKGVLRDDLAYLRSNKLALLKAGTYKPKEYLQEENKIMIKIKELQQQEEVSDIAMQELLDHVLKVSELLKSLAFSYLSAGTCDKEQITKKVFVELFFDQNSLEYSPQLEFECFKKRFEAVGDPIAWFSELIARMSSPVIESINRKVA